MSKVHRTCKECKEPFSYEYRGGRLRATCGSVCRRIRRVRQYMESDAYAEMLVRKKAEYADSLPFRKCQSCGAEWRGGTRQCSEDECQREMRRRISKDYIERHPERRHESVVKYARSDKGKANRIRWELKNPGQWKKRVQYKVRKAGAVVAEYGNWTRYSPVWLQKLDYWGYRCWLSYPDIHAADRVFTFDELDVEHLRELSDGGKHLPANTRPACKPCNQRKKRKDQDWRVLAGLKVSV